MNTTATTSSIQCRHWAQWKRLSITEKKENVENEVKLTLECLKQYFSGLNVW